MHHMMQSLLLTNTMKYSNIVSTTHTITSATTTQWGNEMHNIVKFLAYPYALVLTVLELVVDFFDHPMQTLGMLASPPRRLAVVAPVPTDTPTQLPTPKSQQEPTPVAPVRRRATRKRGLSEIRDLTA